MTNESRHHGLVTADAVRFGGGMGNIERGGSVSGLPRFLEVSLILRTMGWHALLYLRRLQRSGRL